MQSCRYLPILAILVQKIKTKVWHPWKMTKNFGQFFVILSLWPPFWTFIWIIFAKISPGVAFWASQQAIEPIQRQFGLQWHCWGSPFLAPLSSCRPKMGVKSSAGNRTHHPSVKICARSTTVPIRRSLSHTHVMYTLYILHRSERNKLFDIVI